MKVFDQKGLRDFQASRRQSLFRADESEGMNKADEARTLFLLCQETEVLNFVQSALEHGQWIRINPTSGRCEIAPPSPVPALSDDQLVACNRSEPMFRSGIHRCHRPPGSRPVGEHGQEMYIQHIAGYSGDYAKKFRRLTEAGFSLMRSRPGAEDGKHWEIWYLPGDFAAKGEIEGMKMPDILKWVLEYIRPGNCQLNGESWALTIE